ncbi:unnamed protein product [Moneuplotes crassus]|uniref:Uncharacterized protein n=1 Tax=Euplotes crassus TaxID=5936 RepID=A0AAD2D3H3_EUPCR|nr:unnamed protein product [Moneuplotes crassus]
MSIETPLVGEVVHNHVLQSGAIVVEVGFPSHSVDSDRIQVVHNSSFLLTFEGSDVFLLAADVNKDLPALSIAEQSDVPRSSSRSAIVKTSRAFCSCSEAHFLITPNYLKNHTEVLGDVR